MVILLIAFTTKKMVPSEVTVAIVSKNATRVRNSNIPKPVPIFLPIVNFIEH
jgi:hypothetical protein